MKASTVRLTETNGPGAWRPASWVQAGLAVGDIAVTFLALRVAELLRHALPLGVAIVPADVYVTPRVLLVVALIWVGVLYMWEAYSWRAIVDATTEGHNVTVGATFALFAFASFVYFLKIEHFSRLLMAYFYVLDVPLLLAHRAVARHLFARLGLSGYTGRRLLVVGKSGRLTPASALSAGLSRGSARMDVVGKHAYPAATGDIAAWVRQVLDTYAPTDVLLMPGSTSRDQLAELILELQQYSVDTLVVPSLLELATVRTGIDNVLGLPVLRVERTGAIGAERVLKRGLDIVVSAVGLLVLAPLMLLVAALIKMDSPGPVLFTQVRAGQFGRPFRMRKFRTMRWLGPQTRPGSSDKRPGDPRVTRAGRWLRRTSLDELPQLFNVLLGDMSLVGPRPEELDVVAGYTSWQRQRLILKPGMTGPMQVCGRASLSLDERVNLELAYIRNCSIWEDVKILARTLPAVVLGRGSY
jgi:exopolysaccharide biosynthesis polyprenyl glycosylphosphotransferase